MNLKYRENVKAVISIIGASKIDKKIEKLAIEVGKLLAKNGFAIACGGLTGVMEAVCRGAKEEGGFTIGIIPQKEKSAANAYVDLAIPVPFSQARNIVVVLTGDLVVAIGGKAGTLTEMALAWIYGKQVIALTGIEGWSSTLAGKAIDDRRPDKIYPANSPEEIVQKVQELLGLNHDERDFAATNDF